MASRLAQVCRARARLVHACPRVLIRSTAVAAALATATAAIGLAAPASQASTLGGVRAQIRAAQTELSHLESVSQTLAQAYDAGQVHLQAAQARASADEARVTAIRASQVALRREVNAFAVATYTSGGGLNELALLTSSSGPQSLIQRAEVLQSVSQSQTEALSALAASDLAAASAQRSADQALAAARAQTARLAADRTRILASAAAQTRVLRRLQSEEARILAAAQAARLAAEAAAVAAAARLFAAASLAPSGPAVSNLPPGANPFQVAVHWAYAEIGTPYVWGGNSPGGFDCSGLTQFVWGKAGVALEHNAAAQYNEGSRVSPAQLVPGDLVFFVGSDGTYSNPGHVGVYIGTSNGVPQMIDAPYTGTDVQIDSFSFTGQGAGQYIGATDPMG